MKDELNKNSNVLYRRIYICPAILFSLKSPELTSMNAFKFWSCILAATELTTNRTMSAAADGKITTAIKIATLSTLCIFVTAKEK